MAPTLWPSGDGMNTAVRWLRPNRSANCRLRAPSESSVWLTAFGGPVVLEVNMRCAVVSGTSMVRSGGAAGPCTDSRVPSLVATATPVAAPVAARWFASSAEARRFRPA